MKITVRIENDVNDFLCSSANLSSLALIFLFARGALHFSDIKFVGLIIFYANDETIKTRLDLHFSIPM